MSGAHNKGVTVDTQNLHDPRFRLQGLGPQVFCTLGVKVLYRIEVVMQGG